MNESNRTGTEDTETATAEDIAAAAVAADATMADLEQEDDDLDPASSAANNITNTLTNDRDELLDTVAATFTEAFPVTNEIIYESNIHLKDRMNELAKVHGFLCISGPGQITCSRGGLFKSQAKQLADKKGKTPVEKQRKSSSNKCGCKFGVRISKLDKASKLLHPDAPPKAVRIISANFYHTNGCSPGLQQLIQAKKRAGLMKGKKRARTYTRNVLASDSRHRQVEEDHDSDSVDAESATASDNKKPAAGKKRCDQEEYYFECKANTEIQKANVEKEKANVEKEKANTEKEKAKKLRIENAREIAKNRMEWKAKGMSDADIDKLFPIN